jgi:hypothetical protein
MAGMSMARSFEVPGSGSDVRMLAAPAALHMLVITYS